MVFSKWQWPRRSTRPSSSHACRELGDKNHLWFFAWITNHWHLERVSAAVPLCRLCRYLVSHVLPDVRRNTRCVFTSIRGKKKENQQKKLILKNYFFFSFECRTLTVIINLLLRSDLAIGFDYLSCKNTHHCRICLWSLFPHLFPSFCVWYVHTFLINRIKLSTAGSSPVFLIGPLTTFLLFYCLDRWSKFLILMSKKGGSYIFVGYWFRLTACCCFTSMFSP